MQLERTRSAGARFARARGAAREATVPSSSSSTILRRFAGPQADELTLLCRPEEPSPDPSAEAEAVYASLAARLACEHASFQNLVTETLFLRDIRRDLARVLDVRARVLAEVTGGAGAPPPAFIQHAPLTGGAVELAVSAVIPHRRDAWEVRDVAAVPSCPCTGCARSAARVVRLGDQTSIHTTTVHGTGDDAFAQALDMFHSAERLLARCGMGFSDVIRTWIYLRDIDRDYDALNRARREFFQRCGLDLRPASTGVQGVPFPDGHDFSIRVQAVRSTRPLAIARMSTPTLNEAWSYGADFSRGLRVADANKVTLHVSGTASIDEAGRTVHLGDAVAQGERMLHNIETLLAAQGATFADLVSGVVYLKRPEDAPVLRALCRQRGFDGFPCTLVEAPLCRPELLCEAEAVATLPLDSAEA
jgi:enamine deaminase RidA (YjgF/YER057c/UK114 family)